MVQTHWPPAIGVASVSSARGRRAVVARGLGGTRHVRSGAEGGSRETTEGARSGEGGGDDGTGEKREAMRRNPRQREDSGER